jgi:hypothetical protein
MVIVVFNGALSTIILHVHNDSTFPANAAPKISFSMNVGTCVGITHGTHGIAQGSGGIKHKLSSPPKAYDYSTCNEAIIPRHTVP